MEACRTWFFRDPILHRSSKPCAKLRLCNVWGVITQRSSSSVTQVVSYSSSITIGVSMYITGA